jgi:hypothetical protein
MRTVLGNNPQRAGDDIIVIATINPEKHIILNNDIKIYFTNSAGNLYGRMSVDSSDNVIIANDTGAKYIVLNTRATDETQRGILISVDDTTKFPQISSQGSLRVLAADDIYLITADDINLDGLGLISDIRTIYDNYGYRTEILAASIRSANHVSQCALAGADVVAGPDGHHRGALVRRQAQGKQVGGRLAGLPLRDLAFGAPDFLAKLSDIGAQVIDAPALHHRRDEAVGGPWALGVFHLPPSRGAYSPPHALSL